MGATLNTLLFLKTVHSGFKRRNVEGHYQQVKRGFAKTYCKTTFWIKECKVKMRMPWNRIGIPRCRKGLSWGRVPWGPGINFSMLPRRTTRWGVILSKSWPARKVRTNGRLCDKNKITYTRSLRVIVCSVDSWSEPTNCSGYYPKENRIASAKQEKYVKLLRPVELTCT